MKMTEKKRSAVKGLTGVAFILVFLAVGALLTDVLRQKWNYSENNGAQQIVEGYYEEPAQSLDVLYLGGSAIRNGVSPLEIFAQYGIAGYSRATSEQIPLVSYHLLLETLESQDIKAVVMDATTLSNALADVPTITAKIHEAVDYMPLSKAKLSLIRDVVHQREDASWWDFLLPMYSYHDRWTEIEEDDFTYDTWNDSYYYKGQFPALKATLFTYTKGYMTEDAVMDQDYAVDENAASYFEKMIELCRERDIAFIMVHAPGGNWDLRKHEILGSFAKTHDVTFLDYSTLDMLEEIGFDQQTDYYDNGKHLNITGAQKLSTHLGAYLSQMLNLEDKREQEAYGTWWSDYEKYAELLADAEVLREDNLVSVLKKLNNPSYLVMMATRNDTSAYFNDSLKAEFQNLGLSVDLSERTCQSYVAVINRGEVVYEGSDRGEQVDYTAELEGHLIQVSSFANPMVDNLASIYLDGENFSPMGYGINLVVYNHATDQIVCRRAFNTGLTGDDYLEADVNITELRRVDPCAFMETVFSERYLVAMAVTEDAAMYLPGSFDKTMQSLGLESLRGRAGMPYAAIIDGGEIVYSSMGEQHGTVTKGMEIDGLAVNVRSDCGEEDPVSLLQIGDNSYDCHSTGLHIVVYDKLTGRVENRSCFGWTLNNYNESSINFQELEGLKEFLECGKIDGRDIICLYDSQGAGVSEETAGTLREAGFDGFDAAKCYIGVWKDKELSYEESAEAGLTYDYKTEAAALKLVAKDKTAYLEKDGLCYAGSENGQGVVIGIYDAEADALLAVKSWN